jgi:hypothetical protein
MHGYYTIYEACPIYGLVFLVAQNTCKLTEQGVVLETTPHAQKLGGIQRDLFGCPRLLGRGQPVLW